MMMYTAEGRCENRHEEFVRSIFVDISEKREVEKSDDLSTALDELLSRIFDGDG